MVDLPSIDVLLIEDSEIDALFVTRLLKASKELTFTVQKATTMADAMPLLQTRDFDIAIVDLCLPDAIGLEAFEQVRSVDARIPIIVFSGSDDEDAALHAIESGAQDFVAKGHVTGQMLERAVRFAIARQRKVMGIQAAADTDPLTGMNNRRHLESQFAAMHANATADSLPMCFGLFDVDHFKRVNDVHGHFVGDAVLKEVAQILIDAISPQMFAARLGGEEFALLMPGCDQAKAASLIRDILARLAQQPICLGDCEINLTASAGLIAVGTDENWDEAFVACDAELYRAKEAGRNQLAERGSKT